MQKGHLLYEGKAKSLFATESPDILWMTYKDDTTALNGARKTAFTDKGKLNNQISTLLFHFLEKNGVQTHLLETLSDTEQLVKKVTVIPIEIIVRNVIAGSFAKKLGVAEGEELAEPIVEFYYKEDALDDPFINDDHVRYLKLVTTAEIAELKELALTINTLLQQRFLAADILLVDFKIECGRLNNQTIVLADEISPDSCRLWDVNTKQKLDKDVFRHDLGDLVSVYQEVLQRLLNKTTEV
ncbi:phosphoribosylaminoimidazole succinocarboxamide synthetase [Brochothrix thermosphacta]|uniref:phosphoribosylaminoimidazolesuccinocarboxamide synthase n=1 Tax=Brochothrix thermosphacta TaxID=2756 RepID=UPI000D7AACE4|nr:phosphoribosylaminoimidazolesuccinocarboxamide synthase [Brochothrix thermosphacta]SPP27179.1 phosphoribosylaminoimidazole succinocarboxamide synthetase [Brochothrix thermosphacta]